MSVERRPALRQREVHRLIERGRSARAVGTSCAARAGERRHRTVCEAHAAQLVPLVLSHVEERAVGACLLYTSPSPRDRQKSRMPSSA